ncbi:hypothetical protein [Sandarakinorhabdus oryzae]|uniref:hypothetical protein n=1 Tax=Sandarakinorhabdus oryzae TaxID=2675220 RepID=UPI0012E13CA9|nr:hypothetical protein [Sandarakinorhabdus oryzae]
MLLLLLPLTACAPDLPPEQVAARRAEALARSNGKGDGTILAPIAGLDGEGKPGICGLIETPAGPVRIVVSLAERSVRSGLPAAQGGHRMDIGESRFCSDAARARWEQQQKIDTVGLMARVDS